MDAIDRYLHWLGEPGVLDQLRQTYQIDEDDSRGEVATEEHVAEAERELGVPLPPSYRKLVTTVPVGGGAFEVTWVFGPRGSGPGIVAANRGASGSPFPPFLVGVVELLNGDVYCFDTRYPDKRGEYPIVLFDHEVHGEETDESTDMEIVANDLGEFLWGSAGGTSGEGKQRAPRIWELPASTVIRKGRSFARRRWKRLARPFAPSAKTAKPADREWPRQRMSPLLAAVDANDLRRAAELLSEGTDPNAVSYSSTPLKWALSENYREMISLLLEYGADPRALVLHQTHLEVAFERDPALGAWLLGQTPAVTVLDAAEAGTLEDVRRIVDAGGDVNMVSADVRLKSPLHAAVRRRNREMTTFLLDRGADLVGRGSGYPILFVAATQTYSAEMTDLLLRRGADPNATDSRGLTPLFDVAASRGADVLDKLIRGGADVNFRSPEGANPLHAAARNTDPEGRAIRILVGHGARLDAHDHLGYTPLHVALEHTHADSAMTLLDLGADPTIRDREGRTPAELVGDGVRLYPGIPEVLRRIGRNP